MCRHIFFITCLVSSIMFSNSVFAAKNYLSRENLIPSDTERYWTSDRLRNAKPMPMPTVDQAYTHQWHALPDTNDMPNGEEGAPPSMHVKPENHLLFIPLSKKYIVNKHILNLDAGTTKEQFSSSRLIPLSADNSYPYMTVGKLFFTQPGKGDFVCSASVLRPRILLTAGHCVHSGSNGNDGFFTNWLFVPAYRDGNAPYQKWNWKYVAVTEAWSTGAGIVPNAADYAMLELEDKTINDKVTKIGAVTGFLGYQTLSLSPNQAHLLGYPCNLDNCNKMHQVTAQSAKNISPNNVTYGSDMTGGSSGGPWVQNFGEYADGQTGGTNHGINRVIGITSWGYTDTKAMSQGSSIPDKQFTDLLEVVCNHNKGNCKE